MGYMYECMYGPMASTLVTSSSDMNACTNTYSNPQVLSQWYFMNIVIC